METIQFLELAVAGVAAYFCACLLSPPQMRSIGETVHKLSHAHAAGLEAYAEAFRSTCNSHTAPLAEPDREAWAPQEEVHQLPVKIFATTRSQYERSRS